MTSPVVNPFLPNQPVTDFKAFFNREREREYLRILLESGSSCQIVAPDGYGKTSFLKCLGGFAAEWNSTFIVSYIDLNDEANRHPEGFIETASEGWNEGAAARGRRPRVKSLSGTRVATLSRLAEQVAFWRQQGHRPILCIDNFEAAFNPTEVFPGEFFVELRSIAQRDGLSMVTASCRVLSEFLPRTETSPFFNIFPKISLDLFSPDDAHDFVTIELEGVEPFTAEERNVILEFAAGHPLKLQTACFEVLEAKRKGDSTASAIVRAMNAASLHTAA